MNETDRRVRHEIFDFILDRCRPPTVQDLMSSTGYTGAQIEVALSRLHAMHHIVLHPKDVQSPTPISMAHPFSHIPTPYIVTCGIRSWYANCAWCAFGLASMLSPEQTTIKILSSEGKYLLIQVANDQIQPFKGMEDYCCTFSPSPSTWWNDVRFACGAIQLCTTRHDAELWHQRWGFHAGDVMNLQTLWKLSKAWYHDKHKYEYDRKTPEEAQKLFNELGLTSEYWSS